jgi:peptidoglycan hydrolase-like protein with peptidoglycan-binding domain
MTMNFSSPMNRRTILRGALVAGAAVVVAPTLLAGTAQAYGWSRTLKQGMSGADVKELQIRVAGWAADHASQTRVSIDGDFGAGTDAAVKRFQAAYGLSADGEVGPNTQAKLNALEQSDGSTPHFNWSDFTDRVAGNFENGKVSAAEAKENVRRLMYKLEALRKKLGDKPITVNSGFRSIQHNKDIGGASDSMHLYGTAADLDVPGVSNKTVYQHAETCGFSGLEKWETDHQHVDSRADVGHAWWWEDGTI